MSAICGTKYLQGVLPTMAYKGKLGSSARGTFFRLQVYKRVGISQVEVYKVVGKLVIFSVSNDPDKNYSIFYCSVAICFPHIETVMFSDQEFIN